MDELDHLPSDPETFSYRDRQGRDKWDTFTPVFGALTVVGATSYSGRYRFVGRKCEFQVKFSAATSIASTAGTDYLTLPVAATGLTGMAVMTDDTSNIAIGLCHVDVATSRCYLPTQLASADIFNITGSFEV